MAIRERDRQDVSHHPESHGEKPHGVPGVRYVRMGGIPINTPAETYLNNPDVAEAIEGLEKNNKGILMEPTNEGVHLKVFSSRKAAIEAAAALSIGGAALAATGVILLLKSERGWRAIKEIPHPHFWLPRHK